MYLQRSSAYKICQLSHTDYFHGPITMLNQSVMQYSFGTHVEPQISGSDRDTPKPPTNTVIWSPCSKSQPKCSHLIDYNVVSHHETSFPWLVYLVFDASNRPRLVLLSITKTDPGSKNDCKQGPLDDRDSRIQIRCPSLVGVGASGWRCFNGAMAERSKACDSSDKLACLAGLLIWVSRRGFKSHSHHFLFLPSTFESRQSVDLTFWNVLYVCTSQQGDQ